MTPTIEQQIDYLKIVIIGLIAALSVVCLFFFYQLNKLNREVGEIKAWVEIQKQSKQAKGE